MRLKSRLLFGFMCLLLGSNMAVNVEAIKSKKGTESRYVIDPFRYVTARRGSKRGAPRDSLGKVLSLHYPVDNNRAEKIRDALGALDVDANERDSDGNTPLHVAVAQGKLDCVKKLLCSRKVDVNAANAKGATPLHVAINSGNTACVMELLSSTRINPYITDYNMNTIWHVMFRSNVLPVSMIKSILAKSEWWESFCDCINEEDIQGKTPLDLLKLNGKLAQFKQLIPLDKIRGSRLPIELYTFR